MRWIAAIAVRAASGEDALKAWMQTRNFTKFRQT